MLNKILTLLADGQFHSGEELGEYLGMSRAAVWKHMSKLDELGIPYSSVRGRGYRLQESIELLNKGVIESHMRQKIDALDILFTVDSTNTYLMQQAADHVGKKCAVLAEKQNAGRGRRGRQWVSPFGKNIYLSLLVTFPKRVEELSGLSLMAAIAVERALTRLGVFGVQLKWPNDVYVENKKLAGILLEVAGQYPQHSQVVIGVGLNVSLNEADAVNISQPWAQLKALRSDLSRNAMVGILLNELLVVSEEFSHSGFAPFQEYWCDRDVYLNKEVRVVAAQHEKRGIIKGVNRKGELMLFGERGMEIISAGEISVRALD